MGLFDFGKKKREAAAAATQTAFEQGMQQFETAKTAEYKYRHYAAAANCFRTAADAGHAHARYMLGQLYYNGWGFDKDDDEEAARWTALAAEQGDAEAQFFYGFLFEMGSGVKEDIPSCLKWYELAAEQGHNEAKYRLGRLCFDGRICPKSKQKAEALWRSAAEAGYEEAVIGMADLCLKRKDPEEAEKWYRIAEEMGNTYASDRLDEMGLVSSRTRAFLERSDAIEEERRKIREVTPETAADAFRRGLEWDAKDPTAEYAEKWITAAAENGCGEAAYELSERWRKRRRDPDLSDRMVLHWLRRASELGYMEGRARLAWAVASGANGAKVDLEEARSLWQEAANAGHTTAKEMLQHMDAPLIYAEELYEQDKKKAAFSWFRIAAERGYANGMYRLGECYYKAEGTGQDWNNAKYWLRKAHKNFHPEAEFLLGIIAIKEKDYPEAIHRFTSDADGGEPASQYNLALAYEWNNEPEKGHLYLRLSATQGHDEAQYHLAHVLLKGIGTEINEEEALVWVRRCIEEHRHARAMYMLGYMYENALGGLKTDPELASDWLEKSAEAGYPRAMTAIAARYASGKGREESISKAIHWARCAQEAGDPQADDLLDRLRH